MSTQLIIYRVNPPVNNEALNALFATAWRRHETRDFAPVLTRSLAYICAYREGELVGFVNVAWDGGRHAFLLDPTVRADLQRQGVGTELVRRAVAAARDGGVEWLHVDYEAALEGFYRRCGFHRPERAGIIRLYEGKRTE